MCVHRHSLLLTTGMRDEEKIRHQLTVNSMNFAVQNCSSHSFIIYFKLLRAKKSVIMSTAVGHWTWMKTQIHANSFLKTQAKITTRFETNHQFCN